MKLERTKIYNPEQLLEKLKEYSPGFSERQISTAIEEFEASGEFECQSQKLLVRSSHYSLKTPIPDELIAGRN